MSVLAWVLMLASMVMMAASVFFLVLGSYEKITQKLREYTTEYVKWMQEALDQQFVEVSAGRCVAYIVGSSALFAAFGLLLLAAKPYDITWNIVRLFVCGFLAAGPFKLPIGWNLPRAVVQWMWNRRVSKFDDQLMEGLTLMSNALKSGLSLLQSMDMVVREMDGEPVSQEFSLVLRQQQLGMSLNDSLGKLEERMNTENARIVVTAIAILRETGGNLSETFDTIAYTIRERKKVQGKIEALTAMGIMQGAVIFAMPFVLGAILYFMDPVLISRMWQTNLGLVFMFIMIGLQAGGAWLMKQVIQIEV